MLFSKNRFYRQAEQSDKHLLTNGPVNLMVDSRGVTRPFGLSAPLSAPDSKVLDKQGSLRRDIKYSHLITYFDSYNNAESEPSPATDYIGLNVIGLYKSVGFLSSPGGMGADFSKILVSGQLEKEDGFYNGKSIAVEVTNDDRKTEFSQWQYRKIDNYYWDSEQDAGVFELSRPLVNVDTDPEDRQYNVKVSDVDCEEGVVGGKSSGKQKLILDPSASTDVGSYRLKVIRITAGVGKGQSRLIADACLNANGLVEITLAKPWKTKPKFVDDTKPEVQQAQAEWRSKKNVQVQYFNKWFSSEYMIYDPMRHSGLCVDGEVSSYDKKTGLLVVDGLGNGSSLLSGQVVRFVTEGASTSLVVSLDDAHVAEELVKSEGLLDKSLRITSGPGAGAIYVIVNAERSGENSISLTLSSESASVSVNGTPNSSSTYVIYSDDPISSPDLTIGVRSAEGGYGFSNDDKGNFNWLYSDESSAFSFTNKSQIGDEFSIYLRGDLATRFREKFVDSARKAKYLSCNVLHLNGNKSFGFTAAINSYSFLSDGSYEVFVSNSPAVPGMKKFKNLLTDNLSNTLISSLGIYSEIKNQTYDAVDDNGYNPGFKIYVSSLADLGLDPSTYIPGTYSLTFSVSPELYGSQNPPVFRITRPIISLHEVSEPLPSYVVVSGNLPILHSGSNEYNLVPVPFSSATVIGNSLMDGYYTGWKAFFYNPDNDSKPKLKFREARVAGYFDSNGSILLDTKLSGVGPGWQVVLYSEYSRCLGTSIAPYDSDEIYLNRSNPARFYQDYVPLDVFASNEEKDAETGTTPYEGWTLKVLSSSKTKKNGKIKYKTFSDKKTDKSKRTIVKYFPLSRRAYVFYKEEDASFPPDESQYFSPGLDGSEHLWLYDESSAVDFLFNEDSDSGLVDERSEDYGCRILVSNIRPCALPGVDKIRLYRASDINASYHLVATLDNKLQEYEDNIPDEELTRGVDYGNTPPPPCGCATTFKGIFALGGVPDSVCFSGTSGSLPQISPIPSSYYALYEQDFNNPIFEGYTYTDGSSINALLKKSVLALSVPFNPDVEFRFPVVDKLKSEKVNVSFLISEPTSPGLLVYSRQPVISGRTQMMDVHLVDGSPQDDVVYLPRSASSFDSFYDGCRVTIHAPNDSKDAVSRLIGKGDYTGVTRCLDSIHISEFYTLPSPAPSRYPSFPFSIDRLFWSVRAEVSGNGYKYFYSDVFGHTDIELKPNVVNGPDGTYLAFHFTAHQGSDYSTLEYRFGGDLGVLGSSATGQLLAFSFSDTADKPIENYFPALGELKEERTDAGLVMTIPGLFDNQRSASVFTKSSDTPFSRSSVGSDGSIWRIAVFDKYISPDDVPSGPTFVSCKSNAYTVYFCSPTSGDSEKVTLANTFTFADDYGDRITGLVGLPKFIVVFKERAVYALDPFEPSIVLLNREIGCVSTDSIASGRSGVYWFSADRRVLRSGFNGDAIYYASKEIQPWLDEECDIDGESFDSTRIKEVKATYDADNDEYTIAFPTKSGKWFLFAFCDSDQTWFRIYDHSGTDELCSENAFNCLFKHHGRASFASDYGVYSYSEGERPSFYPWKYASVYLFNSNPGMRKLVKRIQVINLIDNKLPSDPLPSAYFEFYRNLSEDAEESYQQEGRYTRRFFDTNKYVQYVHVGVRALLWNFIMFSSDQDKVSNANFVRIHDFVLHYRNKHDDEPLWGATPYADPPHGTS